jgi:hypothetical protein
MDEYIIVINEYEPETLFDYISKNIDANCEIKWKTIFFQIVSTIVMIQQVYPLFKHNNLTCRNIVTRNYNLKKTILNNGAFKYNVNGISYIIPHIGIIILISNFENSTIDSIDSIDSTELNNLNEQSDLIYFMDDLTLILSTNGLLNKIPSVIKNFIYKYSSANTNLTISKTSTVLQNDDFFDCFKSHKK